MKIHKVIQIFAPEISGSRIIKEFVLEKLYDWVFTLSKYGCRFK